MKTGKQLLIGLLFLYLLFGCHTTISFQDCRTPLIRAHAHNDYAHDRPLLDALAHGFRSIEADVHLVGGELYVAHTIFGVRFGRTLEKLYLKPLREHINQNREQIANDNLPLILLIDIKTSARPTYKKLHDLLENYRDMFCIFSDDGMQPGPVMAVISGNRPRRLMQQEQIRYCAIDGRLSDLQSTASTAFMPLISDKWTRHFSWRGEGEMPVDEKIKLRRIVETAHQNGRLIRFWATPDQPSSGRQSIWRQLIDAGVDLINTNDLNGLSRFLNQLKEQEAVIATRF